MEWPKFRRVERQARRLHEMMERVDVDPGALARLRHGEAYAEARTRCLFCGTSDKCLRWLDDPRPANKKPDFCPNLAIFETCKRIGKSKFAVQGNCRNDHDTEGAAQSSDLG